LLVFQGKRYGIRLGFNTRIDGMSETNALCTLLSDRGVVAVTGEDALAFLDNLVTNSLDGMEEGNARFAALLNPQGKMLFEFLAVRTAVGFLLDVRRDKAGELVKRLTLYRLRAKVEIKDVSAHHAIAAVWWMPLGARPTSFTYEAEVVETFADPRDSRLGVRLIVKTSENEQPIRQLSGVTMSDETAYQRARVDAAVAEAGFDYALGDAYPHEANFDLTNGVSFTKGCYVGQEVVSRMQNKTVVRKRVVRVSGAELETGAEIKVGDAAIGTVGTSAGGRALALVRLDRVAEALEKSQPIIANGNVVTIDPAAVERYKTSVANKPVIDL
jgi:folate-binding protein YgfZ